MKLLIFIILFISVFNTMTGTIDNFSSVGTLTYINNNCDFHFDEVIDSYNDLVQEYKIFNEKNDFKSPADLQVEYKNIIAGDGNIFQKMWNVIKWFFENAFNALITLFINIGGSLSLIYDVLVKLTTAFLIDLLEMALSLIGVVLYVLGVPVTV